MEVIQRDTTVPRLLSTAALDVPPSKDSDPSRSRFKLKGGNLLTGNGRAIFVGLGLAVLLVGGGTYAWERHRALSDDFDAMRKFLVVRTRKVTPPASPQPLMVQIDAKLFRVTGISFGHPRIAIINGQEVTEGEPVTVKTADKSTSVTLTVLKIGDSEIRLTDGTHVLVTRLPSRR